MQAVRDDIRVAHAEAEVVRQVQIGFVGREAAAQSSSSATERSVASNQRREYK